MIEEIVMKHNIHKRHHTSSVARIFASFSSRSLMTPMFPASEAICIGVRPSAMARLASAPDLSNILQDCQSVETVLCRALADHLLRALLSLGLVNPTGDVKRSLANLSSSDVDLSPVTQQSLHYRGLA